MKDELQKMAQISMNNGQPVHELFMLQQKGPWNTKKKKKEIRPS